MRKDTRRIVKFIRRHDMNVIEKILQTYPLSKREVEQLISTAPSRYKVHEIKKRNGRGMRTIAQPTAEIKLLQKLMAREILAKLPVSEAAMAYRENLGIVNHATPHANNQYLLKLDFENFFPTIRAVDFIYHLRKHIDIDEENLKKLSRIFFWRPKGTRKLILSIGAPSSPVISNTLLYDFDMQLLEYCRKMGITYTRYADDLALSTNVPNILKNAHAYISKICESSKSPKLIINETKTVYTSRKHRRLLTGLILTNSGTPSIGRDKKRLIRSMAHHYMLGSLKPEENSKLRGWIAFTMSVDKAFVESIRKMIGNAHFDRLMTN